MTFHAFSLVDFNCKNLVSHRVFELSEERLEHRSTVFTLVIFRTGIWWNNLEWDKVKIHVLADAYRNSLTAESGRNNISCQFLLIFINIYNSLFYKFSLLR